MPGLDCGVLGRCEVLGLPQRVRLRPGVGVVAFGEGGIGSGGAVVPDRRRRREERVIGYDGPVMVW